MSAHGIKSATSAFGALRGCFFANKDINLIDKGKVYVAICLSVLLYGSECWRLTEKLYNKLRTFHSKCARAMCRITMHHTIKHHIKSQTLYTRLGITNFDKYCNKRLLSWAGHMARMPMARLPRKMLTGWVSHARPVGAPQMTVGRTPNKSLKSAGISTDFNRWHKLAQDRVAWRRNINKKQYHTTSQVTMDKQCLN